MDITIKIDDTKFDEVLGQELNALSKEELKNIVYEALSKRISEENGLMERFLYKPTYYGDKQPSEWLTNALKSINYNEEFDEFKQVMVDHLKKNQKDLIQKLMSQIFISGLTSAVLYNDAFQNELSQVVQRSLANQNG